MIQKFDKIEEIENPTVWITKKFAEDEKHKYLDKEEKEKCKWLLKNVFQKILIANKIKKGRKVIIKYREIKS